MDKPIGVHKAEVPKHNVVQPQKQTVVQNPKPSENRVEQIMANIHRGKKLSDYPNLSESEKRDLIVALDKESKDEAHAPKNKERQPMRDKVKAEVSKLSNAKA